MDQQTSERMHLITASLSDTGRSRTNNEDAIGADPDLGLLVLADGMGGYNAGEVASGIAVTTLMDYIRHQWTRTRPPAPEGGPHPDTLLLKSAIQAAHQAVHDVALTQPQCAGMGTTIVACLARERRLSIAHVGDSRLYRCRGGLLQPLTRDHSLVEEMIERGHYNREDAPHAVNRNIVTRALGVETTIDVEVKDETLAADDILLLCSDGLTDMLSDSEINAVLRDNPGNLETAAHALVERANDAGGEDNISVVLARYAVDRRDPRHWAVRLLDWI